jgi:hypothetical protein
MTAEEQKELIDTLVELGPVIIQGDIRKEWESEE